MFVRSTDGGLTFSAPIRVNDDVNHQNKWHWFGTFSVAPNGRLDAVWYDTRNAANNTDSQLFYSWSTDAGVTWSPNVAVSNAFNPSEGYPIRTRSAITSPLFQTIPAATWRIPPLLISTRTGANTKKMSITSASAPTPPCRPADHHLRLVPCGSPTPTATATPTATLLLLQLRPPRHQHHQLRPLQDRHRRQELGRRRGPSHATAPAVIGCSYDGVAVLAVAAPRQSEAATTEISQRVRCANFQVSVSSPLIGHNSRQACCSGLGKRASAAIRDYESEIRNRVRFNHFNTPTTSIL